MANTPGDSEAALKLFNRKLTRLGSGEFVRTLRTHGFNMKVTFKIGGKVNTEWTGPNDEAVQAAVLTVRFFIQNNEPCSINNLSNIYEDVRIPNEIRAEFQRIRKLLNDYLDGRPLINMGGEKLTPRKVLEAIVYGDLSHNTPKQRVLYDKLHANDFAACLAQTDFMKSMLIIVFAAFSIGELNKKVLDAKFLT